MRYSINEKIEVTRRFTKKGNIEFSEFEQNDLPNMFLSFEEIHRKMTNTMLNELKSIN